MKTVDCRDRVEINQLIDFLISKTIREMSVSQIKKEILQPQDEEYSQNQMSLNISDLDIKIPTEKNLANILEIHKNSKKRKSMPSNRILKFL